MRIKILREFFWPFIGLSAVVFSIFLLVKELHDLSLSAVANSLLNIPIKDYMLITLSTLLAYTSLAFYDRIALAYIGRRFSWIFISLTSFTSYAVSHNIGLSLISGTMVRYRAYSSKGLGLGEIVTVSTFCSLTFALGTIALGGIALLMTPDLLGRFFPTSPGFSHGLGIAFLSLLFLYGLGSFLHLPPFEWRGFKVAYPAPSIILRQLIAGPIEIIGAVGIIYFALPETNHPGFLTVLGIFLASFSMALLSHAPGGLGVLEFVFIRTMPEIPHAELIAALIVFRLFYLILPLGLSVITIILFERQRFLGPSSPPLPLFDSLRSSSSPEKGTPEKDSERNTSLMD